MHVPFDDDRMDVAGGFDRPEDDFRLRKIDAEEEPYWRGVSSEDGYRRHVILWNMLHGRFGGTSLWNTNWARLSPELFVRLVSEFDALRVRCRGPARTAGPGVFERLRRLRENLLESCEELAQGEEEPSRE